MKRSYAWLLCVIWCLACEPVEKDGVANNKGDGGSESPDDTKPSPDAATGDASDDNTSVTPAAEEKLTCVGVPREKACVLGSFRATGPQKDEPGAFEKVDMGIVGQDNAEVTITPKGAFKVVMDVDKYGKSPTGKAAVRSDVDKTERYYMVSHERKSRIGRTIPVDASAGQEVVVGEVELVTTGSVTGKVLLANHTDHTGIDVYIPGTSYLAKTNATGDFTIDDVPTGLYPFLRADRDGYDSGILPNIEVPSADTLNVGQIQLGVDLGPSGSFAFVDGNYTTQRDVSLTLAPTDDAVLMMISEESTFAGATWLPISTRHTHAFASDGDKQLFIKFANANGLETSPVVGSITVDTNPRVSLTAPQGAISDTTPTLRWSRTRIEGATYRVQISESADFATTMLDQLGVANTELSVTMPLVNGKTYHARVAIEDRGKQWNFSNPQTFTIDLGAVTLLSPTGTTKDSRPTFTWSASALPSSSYLFQLARDAAFSDVVASADNLSTTSHTPAVTLAQGQSYFFRVAVRDSKGVLGSFAGPTQFTVDLGTVDTQCGTTPPANDLTPTLSWCASAIATKYDVRYGTSATLAGATTLNNVTGTQVTLSALPAADGQTYYFSVTPIDENGVAGRASSLAQFRIDTVAPSIAITIANDAPSWPFDKDVPVRVQLSDGSGIVSSWTVSGSSGQAAQNGSGAGTFTFEWDFAETNVQQKTLQIDVTASDGTNSRTTNKTFLLSRYLPPTTIDNNANWTLTDRPYVLTGDVYVYDAVTLTIGPGVTVHGKGGGASGLGGSLWIEGKLSAVGTPQAKIVLNDVDIVQNGSNISTTWGKVVVQHAHLNRGLPFKRWGARDGSLLLTDSVLTDVGAADVAIELIYPDSNSTIARNVFKHCGVLNVAAMDNVAVRIENNVFVDKAGPADVENFALYSSATMVVTKNSFLDVGKIAVRLPEGYDNASMNAVGNYWGTTDDGVVQSMIFDKNDVPTLPQVIPYAPFLSAKDPGTPAYP